MSALTSLVQRNSFVNSNRPVVTIPCFNDPRLILCAFCQFYLLQILYPPNTKFGRYILVELELATRKFKCLRSTRVLQRHYFSRKSCFLIKVKIKIKPNKFNNPTLNHNKTENCITIRELTYPVNTRTHKVEVYCCTSCHLLSTDLLKRTRYQGAH